MFCAYTVILCGALEIPCHPNHQRSDITFQQSPSQNHLQMLRPSVANALVTNNTNETCRTFDCGFISERTAYTNFCLPLLATFRAIYHQAFYKSAVVYCAASCRCEPSYQILVSSSFSLNLRYEKYRSISIIYCSICCFCPNQRHNKKWSEDCLWSLCRLSLFVRFWPPNKPFSFLW